MTTTTHDLLADVDTGYRPGLRAWGQLVLAEGKTVLRDTSGILVPLGLPLLILVMFGMSAAGEEIPDLDGMTALEVFVVPLVLMIVVGTVAVINLPSFLASYRKTGVLRRLAVTPAHPLMVLGAQVIVSAIQIAVGVALALGVAAAAFDLQAPRRLAVAIGVGLLAAAAMYALGMLVAALSPTVNSAVAIGMVVFFAMGATGGMFGPMEQLPDAIARIGEVLPFGAGSLALQAAWIGQAVETTHLLSLGITAVVAGAVATATFRWD